MDSGCEKELPLTADREVMREKRESSEVREGNVSIWLTGERAEISCTPGQSCLLMESKGMRNEGILRMIDDRNQMTRAIWKMVHFR